MPSDLFVRRILPDEKVEFVCKDEDLNSFFRDDCPNYLRELLAVTYGIEFQNQVIAMFSLCNDRLDIHDFDDDRKKLKKAAKAVPHAKRGLKHFPAVKIARLAVKEGLETKGLGRSIVVFIQVLFILKNKTGCRFLTVDSYPDSIGFYEKVGFKKVEKADIPSEGGYFSRFLKLFAKQPIQEQNNDHVMMYLDLAGMVGSPRVRELGSIVDELLSSNKAEFIIPQL